MAAAVGCWGVWVGNHHPACRTTPRMLRCGSPLSLSPCSTPLFCLVGEDSCPVEPLTNQVIRASASPRGPASCQAVVAPPADLPCGFNWWYRESLRGSQTGCVPQAWRCNPAPRWHGHPQPHASPSPGKILKHLINKTKAAQILQVHSFLGDTSYIKVIWPLILIFGT